MKILFRKTKELETQIEILSDLHQLNKEHPLFDNIDHVSAMLSKLIQRLKN